MNINEMGLRLCFVSRQLTLPGDMPTSVMTIHQVNESHASIITSSTDMLYDVHTRITTFATAHKNYMHILRSMNITAITTLTETVELH